MDELLTDSFVGADVKIRALVDRVVQVEKLCTIEVDIANTDYTMHVDSLDPFELADKVLATLDMETTFVVFDQSWGEFVWLIVGGESFPIISYRKLTAGSMPME